MIASSWLRQAIHGFPHQRIPHLIFRCWPTEELQLRTTKSFLQTGNILSKLKEGQFESFGEYLEVMGNKINKKKVINLYKVSDLHQNLEGFVFAKWFNGERKRAARNLKDHSGPDYREYHAKYSPVLTWGGCKHTKKKKRGRRVFSR